jgi:alpha-L-fucosidase
MLRNLITCVRDGGNYLLNIGPKPDGSIPEPSVHALREVGEWLETNGHTIYGSDLCPVRRSNYASFTRKGNTLYMHVHFWPGDYVAISGLMVKVKSAKLVKTGEAVAFVQDDFRVRFTGLPMEAPDTPLTTIAIECDAEPHQDTDFVRQNKPRAGV